MKWLEQFDVLARRVRLLFLDARAAVASCEKVKITAKELHDETWTHNQIAEFKLSLMDSPNRI
jgi:glycerol-3-phosphate dehydrogenase